ncbi:hypothetical protein L210DRAFT_3641812 [Boletus edulis BED1]|uniref:BZIP domain-containing protein n=1 Tax=Boletus edulis BED1 TaxID=1328754 RepID=A0AAD4GJL3_BOLED|nr:hypothetical protein L210DRAFT_3641812 [Boletus edulis BED1]
MAPPNLSGLNVVHPVQQDTHDLASPFPDFSAHLDLWTNLAFESDEPLALSKRKPVDDDDGDDSPSPPGLPSQDNHENAVVPPAAPLTAPPFDINALLAGVGIDPFLTPIPPPAQHSAPQQVHHVPSLAQLLALHAAQSSAFPVPLPSTATSPTVPTTPDPPPAKRARAPKIPSSTDSNSDSHQESTQSEPTAPAATEDKRRRNTAASARFRLKKKEREAALERRAKELEDRVVELERECEGLRRENGWLKGLVVGVTGAGAAQHQHAPSR